MAQLIERMTVAVAVLLLLPSALSAVQERDQAFIGWQGETHKLHDPLALTGQDGRDPTQKAWLEQLSWKPRAFRYHNFLTPDEALHLKRIAAPTMRRSAYDVNGTAIVDDFRTSYNTFVQRKRDAITQSIEERIAEWVMVPSVHQEDMQVVRYGHGQYYKPHADLFEEVEPSGVRMATVLMYLSTVQEGGETAFPQGSEWLDKEAGARYDRDFSPCAKGHVAVKPKLGDALVFWNVKNDHETEDEAAWHTGCPVIKGVKWTAVQLVHALPYEADSFGTQTTSQDPGHCVDRQPDCDLRAAAGECTTNKISMIGDSDTVGPCRLSCNVCQPCANSDKDCYNSNRQKAGYLVVDPYELSRASVS